MTVELEDLVRRAQAVQAERAVSAEEILAALPARAALRRRRRRLTAVATVVVALLVLGAGAVPLVLLRGGGGGPRPADPTASSSAGSLPASIPLAFRPTWLPSGLTELRRQISLKDRRITRTWAREWSPDRSDVPVEHLRLDQREATSADDPRNNNDRATPVDINGTVGYAYPAVQNSPAVIEWRADAGTVLTLSLTRLAVSAEDLLRVARSVRPDAAVQEVPVRFGWLPASTVFESVTVSGYSPEVWWLELDGRGGGGGQEITSWSVALGSQPVPGVNGDQRITLNGRVAFVSHRRMDTSGQPELDLELVSVLVDLGDGHWLTLQSVAQDGAGERVLADLRRIAEQVDVSIPDVSWIGRA